MRLHFITSRLSQAALVAAMLVSVSILTSCGGKTKDEGRVVTVSIEPLRYFTEQIAGGRARVVTMVPKGGNPETYEPSARQMVALTQSDLYIKVGNIGFECTWMQRLQANAPKMVVMSASDGVQSVLTPHGDPDPHVWMSAANARVMARNICGALCRTYVADSAFFKHNLDSLLQVIDHVDANVSQRVKASQAKAFLVYHPVLTYFAHDYGLRQLVLEEEGREPSAADLQRVVDMAKQAGVKTFFVQREFANSNIQVVADETGSRKVDIHPLGYQWDKEMLDVASKLR